MWYLATKAQVVSMSKLHHFTIKLEYKVPSNVSELLACQSD